MRVCVRLQEHVSFTRVTEPSKKTQHTECNIKLGDKLKCDWYRIATHYVRRHTFYRNQRLWYEVRCSQDVASCVMIVYNKMYVF